MDRSPGFGSTPTDFTRSSHLVSLRLPSLLEVNLASRRNSPDRSTKSTRLCSCTSTACKHRVSGSLSLPSRGPFHLSFTVLCAIGHFPLPSHKVPRVSWYSGFRSLSSLFRIRGFHPLWLAFPKPFYYISLSLLAVRTPECSHSGLGSFPFARRYSGNRSFFLFLWVLRCFSSPGSLPYVMDWRMDTEGFLQ